MPVTRETYKGREIVINTERGDADLYIDGEHVKILQPEPGGKYHSPYFFHGHDTLSELARALIERVPRFAPRSPR